MPNRREADQTSRDGAEAEIAVLVSSRSRIERLLRPSSSIQTNSARLTPPRPRRAARMKGEDEPVVLVALLEHGLQGRQADRHGEDAGPVAFLQQA